MYIFWGKFFFCFVFTITVFLFTFLFLHFFLHDFFFLFFFNDAVEQLFKCFSFTLLFFFIFFYFTFFLLLTFELFNSFFSRLTEDLKFQKRITVFHVNEFFAIICNFRKHEYKKKQNHEQFIPYSSNCRRIYHSCLYPQCVFLLQIEKKNRQQVYCF